MLQVLEEVLRRRQSEGWLVGGTVRDRSLGRPSPDLDVVVADDPAKCAEEVSARLGSPWFPLSTRHGAYRVVGPEGHIDLAGLRGRTILDDLALRDFTINAMAIPLDGVGEELVDPFGGLSDLAAGLLVATSDRIFDDDPLRLMRAVRFSHLLGLRIAPPLEALVRSRAGELSRSSHERIVSELAMTLAPRDSAAAVSMLTDLGLLETVLPEMGEEDSSLRSGDLGRHAGRVLVRWLLDRSSSRTSVRTRRWHLHSAGGAASGDALAPRAAGKHRPHREETQIVGVPCRSAARGVGLVREGGKARAHPEVLR